MTSAVLTWTPWVCSSADGNYAREDKPKIITLMKPRESMGSRLVTVCSLLMLPSVLLWAAQANHRGKAHTSSPRQKTYLNQACT